MISRKIFITTTLALTTFFSTNSFATKLTVIKMGCSAWPPFIIEPQAGEELSGIDVDVMKEVAKRYGAEAKITIAPWNRLLDSTKNGDNDVMFSASVNDERKAFMSYPEESISEVGYVFATKKGVQCNWPQTKNVADVPQPIASPLGFSTTTDLQALHAKVDTGAIDDVQNFEKFEKDRAPTIIAAKQLLLWTAAKKGLLDKIILLEPPFKDEKKYFFTVSNKALGDAAKSQALANELGALLKSIKADGTYKKITDKYLKS